MDKDDVKEGMGSVKSPTKKGQRKGGRLQTAANFNQNSFEAILK